MEEEEATCRGMALPRSRHGSESLHSSAVRLLPSMRIMPRQRTARRGTQHLL